MNTDKKINQYYVDIVMNKPNYIEVANSYQRYCIYEALHKYASNWQSVWFNKSYKKEIRYALKDTCKYCFRKKNNSENITEWEEDGWVAREQMIPVARIKFGEGNKPIEFGCLQ